MILLNVERIMPDSACVKNLAVHYPGMLTEIQITEEIRGMCPPEEIRGMSPPEEIHGMRDPLQEETTEIGTGHVICMAIHDRVIYAWSLTEVLQVVMVKEE